MSLSNYKPPPSFADFMREASATLYPSALKVAIDDRMPPGEALIVGPEPSPADRARGVERQVVRIKNVGMTKKPFAWGEFIYEPPPTVILGEPGIDTEAALQADSTELAAAYDAKAAEIEAAEPTNPAQAAAQAANVAALRRRAREIRARLGL